MKKWSLVLLLLLIVAIGFANCGGSENSESSDTSQYPPPTPTPPVQTPSPPHSSGGQGVDTAIRLGFVGDAAYGYMSLTSSILDGLVRDGWLLPSDVSVGYGLLNTEDGESRANVIVASLEDFQDYYESENMHLVMLLNDSADSNSTIGLFMHRNLRANPSIAALFVQSLQDAFWGIDNVRHITRDDSHPRQWITAIDPHLVTTNPQPAPPNFISYTISPSGSLHVGDDITITITASLPDRIENGDILIYWRNETGDIVGTGNSFTFVGEAVGIRVFEVALYSIVMQGDIPRRSRPTDVDAIIVDILAGISPPNAMPIGIRVGDVVGARPAPAAWGQYLGVYTGTRQIELYTRATSSDGGVVSIQWYARRVTGNMDYPPVNLATYLSTENMRGFVPVSNRTETNFSIDTIMSPTPPVFISTNIVGTYDYIARVTNTNNNFPRQNTSYIWTDAVRITFREATPPPYRQFNVFFMAENSDIRIITEDLPARYYPCQDTRLIDFVSYLNNLEQYRILYIHVEGRFNNVANIQPPYNNRTGVRLTHERAHIVRERLIQLGITAPIDTRYNYRQDGAGYMQRRATITVALQRIVI